MGLFIDRRGTMAIPATFELADSFSEGLSAVKLGAAWGFIDSAGRMAIAPQFLSARRFSEGLASVTRGGRSAYIDSKGGLVIAPLSVPLFGMREEFSIGGEFSEGLADAFGEHTCLYLNRSGTPVIRGGSVCAPFSDGLAVVITSHGTKHYLDKTGKIVVDYEK